MGSSQTRVVIRNDVRLVPVEEASRGQVQGKGKKDQGQVRISSWADSGFGQNWVRSGHRQVRVGCVSEYGQIREGPGP